MELGLLLALPLLTWIPLLAKALLATVAIGASLRTCLARWSKEG